MSIVDSARSFIGTPFHHAGRLPGVGLDCIGVVVCAAQAAGFTVRDQRAYPLRPNGMLRAIIAEQLTPVDGDLEPGDVLLMRFANEPHHLALFAGETIIHAHIQARRCVEQPFTQWWRDQTVATFRFPELAT